MRIAILLLFVCLVAVAEGGHRSRRKRRQDPTIIDKYLQAAMANTATLKECVEQCVQTHEIKLERPAYVQGTYPTPNEMGAYCKIWECASDCDENMQAVGFTQIVKMVCHDPNYKERASCLNFNQENVSATCLQEYYDKPQAPEPKPDPKPEGYDEDAEALKAACNYLTDLHTCMKGKFDTVCSPEAGHVFSEYAEYIRKMVLC